MGRRGAPCSLRALGAGRWAGQLAGSRESLVPADRARRVWLASTDVTLATTVDAQPWSPSIPFSGRRRACRPFLRPLLFPPERPAVDRAAPVGPPRASCRPEQPSSWSVHRPHSLLRAPFAGAGRLGTSCALAACTRRGAGRVRGRARGASALAPCALLPAEFAPARFAATVRVERPRAPPPPPRVPADSRLTSSDEPAPAAFLDQCGAVIARIERSQTTGPTRWAEAFHPARRSPRAAAPPCPSRTRAVRHDSTH